MASKEQTNFLLDTLYHAIENAAQPISLEPSVSEMAKATFRDRVHEIADALLSNPGLLRHQENCARRAGRRAAQLAAQDGCAAANYEHFRLACEDVRAIAHRTLKRVHGENWAVAQGGVCGIIDFFDLP